MNGERALHFETMLTVAGKRVLSAPVYQVRCRCPNRGCGTTFTALSTTPQKADDPPRLRDCDRCFDAATTPTMVATRHTPWERECTCGERTHLPHCPVCKADMPAPPGRGFPVPRYCARCHAVEYLSVAGRILLECAH